MSAEFTEEYPEIIIYYFLSQLFKRLQIISSWYYFPVMYQSWVSTLKLDFRCSPSCYRMGLSDVPLAYSPLNGVHYACNFLWTAIFSESSLSLDNSTMTVAFGSQLYIKKYS